ncbi:MAG: hypothetical protein AAF360_01630, partial [Pseudomonadota bacterium]
AAAMIGRPSRWPVLPVLLTLECRAVEASAAQRALALSPRPLEDTIRDEIAWIRRSNRTSN